MGMKLFEYAVIHNPTPTKEESERGVTPKSVLVVKVTTVLCNSEKEASMLASRDIPEELTDKLDELEIVLRPF